jgi:hypothetical protein
VLLLNFLTLLVFHCLSRPDGWSEINRQVSEYKWYAWMVFVPFVAISGFIAFNLIIAVVCDAINIVAKQMELEKAQQSLESGSYFHESDHDALHSAQERIFDLQQHIHDLLILQEQLSITAYSLKQEYSHSFRGLGYMLDSMDQVRQEMASNRALIQSGVEHSSHENDGE